MKPFETDGCSGGMSTGWRTLFNTEPPWNDLCVDHDRLYWAGGTKRQRLDADAALLSEVAARGYPWIAVLMFLAVRFGGHPLLPLPWRWGYGHKWPRCYER